jgi:hypothetical protein
MSGPHEQRNRWSTGARRLFFALLLVTAAALAAPSAPLLLARPLDRATSYATFNGGFPGSLIAARPADLNGDGLTDLLLVTGLSAGKQRFETVTRGNAIFAELVAYQVQEMKAMALVQLTGGGFALLGEPLALNERYIAFDLADLDGDGLLDLLLLDDDGVELRQRHDGGWLEDGTRLLQRRTTFSGCRQFFGGLRFLHDLDGDGLPDLVLPCYGEALVRFAPFPSPGKDPPPGSDILLAGGIVGQRYDDNQLVTRFPAPQPEDCNGDGLLDLLFHLPDSVLLFPQQPGRTFAGEPLEIPLPKAGPGEEQTGRHFGDMTGDGIADLLLFHTLEKDDSFREEKNPKTFVELFPGDEDLVFPEKPVSRSLIRGIVATGDGGGDRMLPSFLDLNGDGLLDLLGISFDVGMFQLVKLATVQKITVEIFFKNYLQNQQNGFEGIAVHEVQEKIKLNLRDLQMPEFPFFSGDFNGDGIRDYIRFQGGTSLGVHFSAGDGTYSKKPDLKINLPREARDPDLLLISDLNGDPRSDVVVFKAAPSGEERFQVVVFTSRTSGGGR